jgi:hypothetical protein
MSHPNLAQTPADAVKEELEQSLSLLEKRTGKVKHFAYPYGRIFHINKPIFDAVFQSGYESCASAERGCHTSDESNGEPVLIRRDQVILNWKRSHVDYFLSRNRRNVKFQQNLILS